MSDSQKKKPRLHFGASFTLTQNLLQEEENPQLCVAEAIKYILEKSQNICQFIFYLSFQYFSTCLL